MPITIALRTLAAVNVFRDTIIDALSSGHADEALLCSGFFQENFKGSAYQASREQMLAAACATSGIKLTTVGVHNYSWQPSYKDFRDNMLAAGASVKCLYKPGLRWHAKVFIASRNGKPIIGIIGSSNITRNAFSTTTPFNNECDVFIWPKSSPLAPLAELVAERLDGLIVIRAPYRRSWNQGLTASQKLVQIRREVLGQDLRELS